MTAEGDRGFQVRALGEIAIRCADMAAMVAFYRDMIGLELLAGDETSDIVFFKIAPGHAGHTCVLALFANHAGRREIHPVSDDPPETGARSSLHHIALSVDFTQQDAAMAWYDRHGLAYNVQRFGWIGWRGVFTKDPEGNTVELVAFDPSMKDDSH